MPDTAAAPEALMDIALIPFLISAASHAFDLVRREVLGL